MSVHQPSAKLADRIEAHSDLVEVTDVANAFEALLPITEGDRVSAATLAGAAIIADALQRGRPANDRKPISRSPK